MQCELCTCVLWQSTRPLQNGREQVYTSKDCAGPLLSTLRYVIRSSNLFFRILRRNGVWSNDPDRTAAVTAGQDMCDMGLVFSTDVSFICHMILQAICLGAKSNREAKEGFCYLASMCHQQNMKLYYIRPKLHLTMHIITGLEGSPRALNPLSFSDM